MKFNRDHIWPLFVILILLGSVCANIVLVTSSQIDGGAKPIPNYYENAIEESNRSQNK